MQVSGQHQKAIQYVRRNGDKNEPYVENRRLTTRSGMMTWQTGLQPIESIRYNFDQTRDLRLSTAPLRLFGLRLGTETMRRHQLSASQQIAKLRLFAPKVSWTGSFDGRMNQIQTGAGAQARGNTYNNSNNLSFSASIPIPYFLAKIKSLVPVGGGDSGVAPAPSDSTQPARTRAPVRTAGASPGGILSLSAIGASYTINRTSNLTRVAGEPSLAYQLGLARDPGHRVRELTGAAAGTGDRKDLSLNTDLKVLTELAIRTNYQRSFSRTTANGQITKSTSVRFPDFDVNWGRIHKKLGLDRWAKELRASSRYSRETRSSGTNVNPRDREETTITLRPLLNLDATLTNGISAKLTSAYTGTNSEQFGLSHNISRSRNRQLGLSLRRSLNLTRMVTNPITKKASRVTSKLDVSLAVDMQDNMRESGPVGNVVVLEDRAKLAVSTTAGYNFTSSITGNAGITVGQDSDRKNRTNTARYVSVTVSAAFSF